MTPREESASATSRRPGAAVRCSMEEEPPAKRPRASAQRGREKISHAYDEVPLDSDDEAPGGRGRPRRNSARGAGLLTSPNGEEGGDGAAPSKSAEELLVAGETLAARCTVALDILKELDVSGWPQKMQFGTGPVPYA